MRQILIIVAHPKADSFSFAMANTYKESQEKQNNHVEILDLYRDTHQQSFLSYTDINEHPADESTLYYQEKITKADEIVFVFPYWWGSFPAIMKNFIDCNLTTNFAFKYKNSRPVGLLTNKTAKVLTTTGAPTWIYTLTGANRRLKNTIKEQIVSFCGMKLTGYHTFGGIDTRAKNCDKILEKIKSLR